MATLYHQVWISTSPAKLYQAVSTTDGIGSWWDKAKPTETKVGAMLEFSPGAPHGTLKARVLKLNPGKRVEWEFISTHPKSSPASAWTGTHIVFEITQRKPLPWDDTKTAHLAVLNFRHSGWDENSKWIGYCNSGWGEALQNLKKVCEAK
jgi:uncharacterized protein YndB with AHSA1/START domain